MAAITKDEKISLEIFEVPKGHADKATSSQTVS